MDFSVAMSIPALCLHKPPVSISQFLLTGSNDHITVIQEQVHEGHAGHPNPLAPKSYTGQRIWGLWMCCSAHEHGAVYQRWLGQTWIPQWSSGKTKNPRKHLAGILHSPKKRTIRPYPQWKRKQSQVELTWVRREPWSGKGALTKLSRISHFPIQVRNVQLPTNDPIMTLWPGWLRTIADTLIRSLKPLKADLPVDYTHVICQTNRNGIMTCVFQPSR